MQRIIANWIALKSIYYWQPLAEYPILTLVHHISVLFQWGISFLISFIFGTSFMDLLVTDSKEQEKFTLIDQQNVILQVIQDIFTLPPTQHLCSE